METSWGLLFYPRKPKNYDGGPINIYFRITVNGEEKERNTTFKVDPEKWSTKAQRATGKSELVKAINEYLDVLHTAAIQARTDLTVRRKPLTAENVRRLVQGKPLDQHTIIEVFKEHNKRMEELVGKDYAEGTMERYDVYLRHTQSFMQYQYKVDDMYVNEIGYQFIADYEHWFKTVRQCNHNTTMKYLSNFKKIILFCLKKGWLLNGSPFAHVKLTRRKKRRKPLSKDELDALMAHEFANPRLGTVRDIFVFCCFTGLAYAERFKRSQHGSHLNLCGLFGYIQDSKYANAAERINGWIDELGATNDDKSID